MEMIKNLEVEDDASGDDRKNRQNARHLVVSTGKL